MALATTRQEFNELEALKYYIPCENECLVAMASSPPVSIPGSPSTGITRPNVRINNYRAYSLPDPVSPREGDNVVNPIDRIRTELTGSAIAGARSCPSVRVRGW